MTTEDAFEDARLYRLNKLVLVDSASAAYVELPINQSCAILGANNQGKTSLLHTFLLFLLPEVDFKGCENKFGFQSKGDFHGGLESFNYYFPSPNSYIILEAQNPHHTFCMVLHQSNDELGYGRIVVPCPYENISHLFWDKNSDKNDGAGEHCPDSSIADIQKKLFELKGTKMGKRAELKESLYTRVQVGRADTRYCLVPLGTINDQTVATLKTLLQLSAGLLPSGKNSGLAKAVASVVSFTLSSSKDNAEIDFDKIWDERKELRDSQDHLTKLRSNKNEWEQLTVSYNDYEEVSHETRQRLNAANRSVADASKYHQDILDSNQKDRSTLEDEKKPLKELIKSSEKSINDMLIDQKSSTKLCTGFREKIAIAKNAITTNAVVTGNDSVRAIIDHLDSYKKNQEERLNTLQSVEKTKLRLGFNLDKKKELKNKLNGLQELLAQGKTLLNEMNIEESSLLYSLSPALETVPALNNFSILEACKGFANILGNESGTLTIGGEPIMDIKYTHLNPKEVKESLRINREGLIKQIDLLDTEIQNDSKFIKASKSHQNSEKEKLTEDIKDINKEVNCLSSYLNDIDELKQHEELLEELTADLEKEQLTLDGLTSKHELLVIEVTKIKSQAFESEKCMSELQHLQKSLTHVWGKLFDKPFVHKPSAVHLRSDEIESIGEEVESICYAEDYTLNKHRIAAKEKMRKLLEQEIVTGHKDVIYSTDISGQQFRDAYEELRAQFNTIDEYINNLSDEIKKHNHNTSREISVLKQIDSGIDAFQQEINHSLSGIKISNLDSVELSIQKQSGFISLLSEINELNRDHDELRNEAFYDRLRNFSEAFLQKGKRRGVLEIERIITEVKYIYSIAGNKETTAQSNGTTIMVNTVLLSLLLKRLTSGDLRLSMPVIFDEAAAIDENNLPALHNVVKSVGLTMLAATPHYQMHIGQTLENWYHLFDHQVINTESIGKCLTIFHDKGVNLSKVSTTDSHARSEAQ